MNKKLEEFKKCLVLEKGIAARDRAFTILVEMTSNHGVLTVKLTEDGYLDVETPQSSCKLTNVPKSFFRNFLARCLILIEPLAKKVENFNLYGCSAIFDAAKLNSQLSGDVKFEFKNTTKEQWLSLVVYKNKK